MKVLINLSLAGMLASSVAHAENFTESNTDKARDIITAALDAQGGDAMLEYLPTLTIRHETINYSVDQSRGTEPPGTNRARTALTP